MPTIALVDDDRNILTSVSIALEAEGFNVRSYADVSLTIPRYALRWIDVDTRALVALPAGYADASAWSSR